VLDEHGDPIRERIRKRRKERGLTASELARRAGISPAYMTRIEQGKKVPGEEVAVNLARALDDDPALYLAWIHGRYFSDPASVIEGLHRVGYRNSPSPQSRLRMEREREEKQVEKLTEKRRRLEREIEQRTDERRRLEHQIEERAGKDAPASESPGMGDAREDIGNAGSRQANLTSPRSRLRHWKNMLRSDQPEAPAEFVADQVALMSEAPGLSERSVSYPGYPVRIPVLAHGLDPGEVPAESEHVVDWLWFDPNLLSGESKHVFAYRIDEGDAEVPAADAGPGTLVILTREIKDPPDPERFYAVRTPRSEERAEATGAGPVYLTRVRCNDDSLIVFPPGMSTDVEIIELGDDRDLSRILVGECLMFVRRAPGHPSD
jgi:transcriptional regulator with XRE-family HTH domain